MPKKTYWKIIDAIKRGSLIEPFGVKDLKKACPDLGVGTYNAFLYKHREGNPGGNSELFVRIAPGKYKCIHEEKKE